MGRASTWIEVPGPPEAAEALWHDPARWPAWIDGFGHLADLGAAWPAAGARRVWDARPGGRGRVAERVLAHEAGSGQALAVEDGALRGTLRVTFAPVPAGTRIALELRYELKRRHPFTALEDALLVRRRVDAAQRRTLARFAAERRADVEPWGSGAGLGGRGTG